jgi:choline-sulfatase
MASPVSGDPAVDHADEQIPHMNYGVWAEDVSDSQARVLKTRYYGEITYIDDCLGRILDAVEARPDADNTVICFFADHGDHLGDHQAWQKESFFEASCHIPFLVSWPERLPRNERREDLVALIDLFGIATGAAGQTQVRDGVDVLSMLTSGGDRRERLVGLYGAPGTRRFKAMVREDRWKYIWLANGARQQLFDVTADPQELRDLSGSHSEIVARLHRAAIDHLRQPGGQEALDGDDLHSLPFEARPLQRIYQFGHWPRSSGFPEDPGEALRSYQAATGS